MPMPNRHNVDEEGYRYAYQGQEKDPETGKEAFELRLWDSRIGRWLTTDPKGQYSSPYLGMGNNPINRIDPDGGGDGWILGNKKIVSNFLSPGAEINAPSIDFDFMNTDYHFKGLISSSITTTLAGHTITNEYNISFYNVMTKRNELFTAQGQGGTLGGSLVPIPLLFLNMIQKYLLPHIGLTQLQHSI